MNFDWQTICALMVVAMAVVYVARKVFTVSGSSACGSCSGCSHEETLVKISTDKHVG